MKLMKGVIGSVAIKAFVEVEGGARAVPQVHYPPFFFLLGDYPVIDLMLEGEGNGSSDLGARDPP